MQKELYYLGHSSWAVQVGQYLLVLDYSDDCKEYHEQNKELGLEKGVMNLAHHKDKKVILLFSHNHHDHYSASLHDESQAYDNVISILGEFESDFSKQTVTIRPKEKIQLGDITVYAGGSTDKGVCFLIQLNDFVIFFSGDNADWGDGDKANQLYYPIIDSLAQMELPVDIAFIPVCTSQGERPHAMTEGAIYAIRKLNPKRVFPMHANGKEYLYDEFAKDFHKSGCKHSVVCIKSIGQSYQI